MAQNQTSPSAVGTGTSRAGTVRKARRQPLKARVSLSAPSGAGKTWTGLQIATVLAGNDGEITWIDTEATTEDVASSETYADTFDFELINWQREWGYDPRDLVATLWDLARRETMPAVVGIDSASHFWRGPGGTLDIADGRFTGWKGARPVQDSLIETILRLPYHVILCTRAKMQHAVDESTGRQVVTKLGMGAIQSDDLEYEMQVCLTLDMEHRIDISKTRASVLAGKSWQANHETEFALLYKTWLDKGEQVIRQRDVDAIQSVQRAIPVEERAEWREAFKAQWGSAQFITPEQLDDVWAYIFASTAVEPHPFVSRGEDAPDYCQVCDTRSGVRWHRSTAPEPIESAAQNGSERPHSSAGTHTADDAPTPASDDPGPASDTTDDDQGTDAVTSSPETLAQRHESVEDLRERRDAERAADDAAFSRETNPQAGDSAKSSDPELAERLAAERVIFDQVKAMGIVDVKKGLATRRKRVTGNEATLRANLARELITEQLGADPFVAR